MSASRTQKLDTLLDGVLNSALDGLGGGGGGGGGGGKKSFATSKKGVPMVGGPAGRAIPHHLGMQSASSKPPVGVPMSGESTHSLSSRQHAPLGLQAMGVSSSPPVSVGDDPFFGMATNANTSSTSQPVSVGDDPFFGMATNANTSSSSPPVSVGDDPFFGMATTTTTTNNNNNNNTFPADDDPFSLAEKPASKNASSDSLAIDDQADALLAFASGVPTNPQPDVSVPQEEPEVEVSSGLDEDEEWVEATVIEHEEPAANPDTLDTTSAAEAPVAKKEGIFSRLKSQAQKMQSQAKKMSSRVYPKPRERKQKNDGNQGENDIDDKAQAKSNSEFDDLAFSDSDDDNAEPEWQDGAAPALVEREQKAESPPPEADLLGSFGHAEAPDNNVVVAAPEVQAASPDSLDTLFAAAAPSAPASAAKRVDAATELERMMAGISEPTTSGTSASGFDDLFGGPTVASSQQQPSAGGPMMDFGGGLNNDPSAAAATSSSRVMLNERGEEGEPEERRIAREKRLARWNTQMREKLAEKMERDQAEAFEREERQEAKQKYGGKLEDWGKRNHMNIRALLGSVGPMLWEGNNWKDINMMDLVDPAQVKKGYRMAMLKIHPDKVKQRGGNSEMLYIADFVFDKLKEAYASFEEKELRGGGGGGGGGLGPVHL